MRLASNGEPRLHVTADYFNGSADNDTKALPYNKDDAWIQSTCAELKNDGTARSNTDKLMAYSSTHAAHHCRNQNISGVGQLDLPNLYELIILYLESDNIDALDPTASSNRDKALGKMNIRGRFDFSNDGGFVWSSTECSSSYAYNAWLVGRNGNANDGNQNYGFGAIPVKELS